MFKHQLQHSKNIQTSLLPHRNPPSLLRNHEGYHNIDSPLKAALRLQTSPRKNLSPLRYQAQTDSKLSNRRSRSPIIFSKRDGFSPSNVRVSPLRKKDLFQPQQNSGPPKNVSFTNLIRRNSNTGQYESQNPSQFNRTMDCSNQNYLQSDRNFREDTNLFKKLANMIKSNKSNGESFLNSKISDNSVSYKGMPQSCKNEQSSNKKMFIKNVMTVESIQSPEEKDYGHYEENFDNVETKCYQEYEQMTAECDRHERKGSYDNFKERSEPRMQKKQSKKCQNQLQKFQALTFKKINYGTSKPQTNANEGQTNKIDYHLTNSFGTATRNLKNQIIGCQPQLIKTPINPFQQISTSDQYKMSLIESINCSGQDSMFASLQMLLSKVNGNKEELPAQNHHQSINISIMSDNESSELDMEPFLQKRK